MKLTITSILLSAIALTTLPLTLPGYAEETAECPDEFDGIELSDRQVTQLDQLEAQLDNRIEAIMPIAPETEAKIGQLEETFEGQVEALSSPQQKQQIEQLDSWAEEQIITIVPELLEDDDELILTSEQEARLEVVEEAYEQRFEEIFTVEQNQQIEALEAQLDDAIDAELPEPTTEQEAAIETAEAEFEQGVLQLLTVEQREQLQQNMACGDSEV